MCLSNVTGRTEKTFGPSVCSFFHNSVQRDILSVVSFAFTEYLSCIPAD